MQTHGCYLVRRPSLLPTDAHYVIRHGKHGFYDDVWLSFTKNETVSYLPLGSAYLTWVESESSAKAQKHFVKTFCEDIL